MTGQIGMPSKSIPMSSQCFPVRPSELCSDFPDQRFMLVAFMWAWSLRFERVGVSWLVAESPRYCTLRSQDIEFRYEAVA
jgi:hypothetical protein